MSETKMVFIRESVWSSLIRDAGSFAMLVGLIGVGVLVNSSAMQWLGAVVGFIWLMARASHSYNSSLMTVAQARKALDDIEAAHRRVSPESPQTEDAQRQ